MLTCHEVCKRFGAGGRDRKRQLVHGDPVGNGETVNTPVWDFAREKLPQKDPITVGGGNEENPVNSKRTGISPLYPTHSQKDIGAPSKEA